MKTKKDNKKWFAHWGTLIVFFVAIAMISIAIMPSVMAGKPDKPPVTSDFNLTTLDSRGVVGEYPRMALGANNVVNIIYYDHTNYALKYATNKNNVWTISTLAIIGNKFTGPSSGVGDIVVDSAGTVHVVYIDINHQLQYLAIINGVPQPKVALNIGTEIWGQISMAMDSGGKFHISCYDSHPNGALILYAYGTPGAFKTTAITTLGDWSWYTSMAVGSNNVAHVIYINLDTYVLTYANSQDWTNTIEMQGVDIWANIAIGQGNSVHLSYFTYPNRALNYAVLSGSSFASTVLDSTVDSWSHHSSIAIDSSGWVHIGYMDYPAGSNQPIVKYATNLGGSWNTKLVDGSSNAGSYNDIAVGSDGHARIAYYYPGNSDLKYAISV